MSTYLQNSLILKHKYSTKKIINIVNKKIFIFWGKMGSKVKARWLLTRTPDSPCSAKIKSYKTRSLFLKHTFFYYVIISQNIRSIMLSYHKIYVLSCYHITKYTFYYVIISQNIRSIMLSYHKIYLLSCYHITKYTIYHVIISQNEKKIINPFLILRLDS